MIEYEKALILIKKQTKKLGTQNILAYQSLGYILAEPIVSQEHLPPFDNSAMDGFALPVSSGDIKSGTKFKVAHIRAAGVAEDDANLTKNQCAWIMTGAPMPNSADRVIPIEKVEILEKDSSNNPALIRITEDVQKGAHVRCHGEDVSKQENVIAQGTKIKSAHLAMFAALGIDEVLVRRRPKVALVCTGDELVDDPTQKLKPGQIRNSNSPLLSWRIREAGGELILNETVSDDQQAFNDFLDGAKQKQADIIISCGAVSMGEYDFIPEAVKREGGKVHFHKAAIRPGKPIFFASLPDDILYFGLPGNPVSSAVGLRFFVTPAMRVQLGLEDEAPIKLPLLNEFQPHPSFQFFLKAKIEFQKNGQAGVRILDGQQSFKIRPLLDANCWVSLPSSKNKAKKGDIVNVYFSGHLDNL